MRGILIFSSMEEAIARGFSYFDRTTEGYLVRTKTQAGWALALVCVKQRPALAEA